MTTWRARSVSLYFASCGAHLPRQRTLWTIMDGLGVKSHTTTLRLAALRLVHDIRESKLLKDLRAVPQRVARVDPFDT